MRVVEEDQTSGEDARGERVAGFPHDQKDHRNCQGAEGRRHGTKGNVGDLVLNVVVADVVEQEVAVIAHQPAHKGEKKLAEGRVDIEEVGALQVVGSELGKSLSVQLGQQVVHV